MLLLPLLVFSALAAPKRDWRVFTTTHFELLTDGSDSRAEIALERLERYRAAAIEMQGERILSRLPVRVFLIANDSEFKWLRAAATPGNGVIGIYQATPLENLLAVSSADDKREDGRPLLHEYTHLLLRGYQADWPAWLNEGFAKILETVELSADQAIFGKPPPFLILYLQRKGLVPLTTLFDWRYSGTNVPAADVMQHMYAQSWAVCHYLYFGLPADKQDAVAGFINEVARGKPVATALQERLQLTPEALEAAVKAHLNGGTYRTVGFRLPPEIKDLPKPVERPAAAGEAAAWFGDWAFAKSPELAERRYRAGLTQAPDNPFCLLGLGRVLEAQRKRPEAIATLRKAVEQDPESGWGWLYYGASQLDVILADKPKAGINSMAVDDCVKALQRAAELLPAHPAPQRMLGRVSFLTKGRLQAAIDAYAQAAKLDPADLTINLEAAAVFADHGERAEALKIVDNVLARSNSGRIRKLAQNLRQQITGEARVGGASTPATSK